MNDWEKVAIILARGNSQRIKNKNIIKFQNKPMIYYNNAQKKLYI